MKVNDSVMQKKKERIKTFENDRIKGMLTEKKEEWHTDTQAD